MCVIEFYMTQIQARCAWISYTMWVPCGVTYGRLLNVSISDEAFNRVTSNKSYISKSRSHITYG